MNKQTIIYYLLFLLAHALFAYAFYLMMKYEMNGITLIFFILSSICFFPIYIKAEDQYGEFEYSAVTKFFAIGTFTASGFAMINLFGFIIELF